MKLTDGKTTIEIRMMEWNESASQYTPDWSDDFFSDVNHYDEEQDAYRVEDILYCVEQAMDWRDGIGDFYDYDVTEEELENRVVFVDGLTEEMEEMAGLI